MPYSLTFELYGSNNEGRRADAWRLPPTAEEGLNPGDDAAAIAAAAAAAAGRRRLTAGVGCLAMFNPDSAASYRAVVAGYVPHAHPASQCAVLRGIRRPAKALRVLASLR